MLTGFMIKRDKCVLQESFIYFVKMNALYISDLKQINKTKALGLKTVTFKGVFKAPIFLPFCLVAYCLHSRRELLFDATGPGEVSDETGSLSTVGLLVQAGLFS